MTTTRPASPAWPFVILTGLSLSIGWGIRGNFGHEFGAMIPGALAAMAVAMTSGREDWCRRVAYFGMFGALGWSFGGSISYMQVIAYTHSGHAPSVLYGFGGLFVIGFLWAAPGGAGTALPACLDRGRLTELFPPIAAVFVGWWLEEIWLEPALHARGWSLDWYDTDWLGALVAPASAVLLALVRRRFDRATGLVLYLSAGWWVGFLGLVVGAGLRMTPPRGDNWAGCLGMVLGLLAYCRRFRLGGVALATLVSGFVGGMSFAGASMLKLVEVTCGLETNWHSILEQTIGLFNGLGIVVAMALLAGREPRVADDPPSRRWTEVFAVGFVLLMITYLNLRKNPRNWIGQHVIPEGMYGIPTWAWFDFSYVLMACAILIPLVVHLRRPLPLIPPNWLGKGQWLYLLFLWWMVVGNFERALPGFAPQRLVTEGVIHLNAAIATLLLLLCPVSRREPPDTEGGPPSYGPSILRVLIIGTIVAALSILGDFGIVRAIYGDRFAGHASYHARFGPTAKTTREPAK